ncbi:MAG: SpoIID/LytB domain-containing protein [Gemmatimonadaceae bacterium]|nr:SpoIID/LytB domain-containing protein [Gemmatimonadaceae bacterium]
MRRAGATLLLALAATLACVPSGPRAGGRQPMVRVALAVVPRAQAPTQLTPRGGDLVQFAGKRYRGTLRTVPTDSGVLVVNYVGLEDYLLGVVPLELGERPAAERAALEAQAIAARSYTVARLVNSRAGRGRSEHFDMVPTTSDQVYGGADVERPNASAAVRATRGLVLRYGSRVITAPYSSVCGGETANAQEAWQGTGEPYLVRVSDRVPGRGERYYCDIAPRFYWERSIAKTELDQAVARYLAAYTPVPPGGPGAVERLRVAERFPSGRVRIVELRTARGTFDVRGNDARGVLRAGGEPLPSSYFSVAPEDGPAGLVRVVIQGNGFGHGVGMCQWGAIGRARAGQSARSILRTYFPGTTIGPTPAL